MDKQPKRKILTRNFYMIFAADALYQTAWIILSGSVIQTFLNYYGVSTALIGAYMAWMNIITLAVTLLGSPFSDRSPNAARSMMKFLFPFGLLFLGYLPICVWGLGMSPTAVFVIAFAIGALQYVCGGLRDVYDYKLPYQVIDMRDYNILIGVNGVIHWSAAFIGSTVLTYFTARYDYGTVMLAAFSICALFMCGSALLNSRLKMLPGVENTFIKSETTTKGFGVLIGEAKELGSQLGKLMKMPVFRVLIVPNFLRGICTGAVSMAAVIAIHDIGFTEEKTTGMTALLALASIVGNLTFTLVSRRVRARYLCFGSGILMLLLPVLAFTGETSFYVVYLLICFFKLIMDDSIPTAVAPLLRPEIAGSYHAWRLLIMYGGTALTEWAIGLLLGRIPTWIFLAVAALAQVICGAVYAFAKPMRVKGFVAGLESAGN